MLFLEYQSGAGNVVFNPYREYFIGGNVPPTSLTFVFFLILFSDRRG